MGFAGYGLLMDVPDGWLGRMFDHANDETGSSDNDTRPTVHAGTFAMPTNSADFGSAAIASMTAGDVFVTLVEYTPDCMLPDEALSPSLLLAEPDPTSLLTPDLSGFPAGYPTLSAADFVPEAMHGDFALTNPAAAQYFFSVAGRPFCLYIVCGDATNLASDLANVSAWLQSLVVTPAALAQFTLDVDFGGVTFNPLIAVWGPPPPKTGPISGTGKGVCTLFRGDTGTQESSTAATFTLTGGEYELDKCQDPVTFNGDLSAVLDSGRRVPFGRVSFRLPLGGIGNPSPCYVDAGAEVTMPGVCNRGAGYDNCYGLGPAQIKASIGATFGSPPGTFNFLVTYALVSPDDVTIEIPAEWSGPDPAVATVELLYPAGAPRATAAGRKPGALRRARTVGRVSRVAVGRGRGNAIEVTLNKLGRRLVRRRKRFEVDALLTLRSSDGKVHHRRHRLTLVRPAPRRR